MITQVDTAKSTDRRKVRYHSIDELLAEIDRIVAADKAGKLRCSGNWTAGQTLGHLAAWIDFGWDGYPMQVPWFIRLIVRRKVGHYVRDGLPAGVRIPRAPDGTYGTDVLPTDEGAARLRKALQRLKNGEPARYDSPAFGRVSEEDRIALALRHAELHLGFLHP